MTFSLSAGQLLEIHARLRREFGGGAGVRDPAALASAVARPFATFDGEDLYPGLPEKAAALLHSLVCNHPFIDGNKRVGALAAELFLEVNGSELVASDEDFEATVMAVARGEMGIEMLTVWFRQRVRFRAE
ncbi:MAG: type II toxin-antitoxin system death-on-curing family toxin [Thermoanaerobaculia bacterium]|nr:type II toxin-antitoxin system death-on-curing family toxin [Thermoanaerobaculia bacterium]